MLGTLYSKLFWVRWQIKALYSELCWVRWQIKALYSQSDTCHFNYIDRLVGLSNTTKFSVIVGQKMLATGLLKCVHGPFMVPFYGWGSTASRLEPLRGDSLLRLPFPSSPLPLLLTLWFLKVGLGAAKLLIKKGSRFWNCQLARLSINHVSSRCFFVAWW